MFGNARQKVGVVVSIVAVAAGGAWVGLSGPAASAAGTVHPLRQQQNASNAVEGLATADFQCDSATGAFSVAVHNVQVIMADGVTRWPNLSVNWAVFKTVRGVDHMNEGSFAVAQNATNGLFDGSSSGTLGDLGACRHGAQVVLTDATGPYQFGRTGTLG